MPRATLARDRREVLQRLFEAERGASERVDRARREAEQRVDEARHEAERRIEEARDAAEDEVRERIAGAREAQESGGHPDRETDDMAGEDAGGGEDLRREAEDHLDRASALVRAWVIAGADPDADR
ncbi:hypothetical protein GF314_01020 [bacterium]|nr:hypothetical protein [bacterium]